MKKILLRYRIFTGLLLAFVLLTAVTQTISAESATGIMIQLKLPAYLLPFLGIAKLLGVVAIVTPGFNRIKEWAYAGLAFDFIGATYCMIAVGGSIDKWSFMLLPLLLLSLSYYYHQRRLLVIE